MEVLPCRQPEPRVRILVVLMEISRKWWVISFVLPCCILRCDCTVHEYCLNVANLDQSCHQWNCFKPHLRTKAVKLHDERMVAVQEEFDLHLESYLLLTWREVNLAKENRCSRRHRGTYLGVTYWTATLRDSMSRSVRWGASQQENVVQRQCKCLTRRLSSRSVCRQTGELFRAHRTSLKWQFESWPLGLFNPRGRGSDPIPSLEERFIWSQSYFAFSLFWVLAPIRRIVRVSDHT